MKYSNERSTSQGKSRLFLRLGNERKFNYMYKYESEKNACDKIHNPNVTYLFKVNNENNRKKCVICLKLTIMTLERCQWRRCDVFGNFDHIPVIDYVFPLLTLSK